MAKFFGAFIFGFFGAASIAWGYKQPMKTVILDGLVSGIVVGVGVAFF